MKAFSLSPILGWCALALAAALALANNCAADNSVVYRQGPIVLNETSPTTDLDLDQDGVADFRFSVGILAGLPSPGAPSTLTPYLDSFAFNRNDYLLNAEGRIVLKEAGFKFGPSNKAGENWAHRDSEAQAIAYASGNTWPGFSGKPPEAYLGVRFLSNGAVHYGWIRFVVPQTNPPSTFPVIADWAYESRPNTAIRAGERPSKAK
ncbi:MAG TPA: hypothetical protein P5555_16305 [Candidatus Paceibacterota bacterium]|nr:hypothetical protein [Candidatus Paceibacterota bacterium]